jgi:hypothetical protein
MAADQGEIAWSHVLRQHSDRTATEGFFRGFYDPLTGAANAVDDISLALVLDTATGERLDLIASIVGASRDVAEGITIPLFGFDGYPGSLGFGEGRLRFEGEPVGETYVMPDADFRIVIRAKIALNNARGTAPEIEAAARVAFSAPTVSVRDIGTARCEVWVGRIVPDTDPLFRSVPKLLGRAAGVGLNVVFFDHSTPWGFEGYFDTFGFPFGVLSREGGIQ